MRTDMAAALLGKVRRLYEEKRPIHLVGRTELVIPGPSFRDPQRIQWELEAWSDPSRLRTERRVLAAGPDSEEERAHEVLVVVGGYAYVQSDGRWIKRTPSGWWTPTLCDVVGLPPADAQCEYLSYEEGELDERPVRIVWGRVDGVAAAWWIDRKSLAVAKYKIGEGPQSPPGGASDSNPKPRVTVKFHTIELQAEVPEELFAVPSDIPVDERPAGGMFADLYSSLQDEGFISTSRCLLCGRLRNRGESS